MPARVSVTIAALKVKETFSMQLFKQLTQVLKLTKSTEMLRTFSVHHNLLKVMLFGVMGLLLAACGDK